VGTAPRNGTDRAAARAANNLVTTPVWSPDNWGGRRRGAALETPPVRDRAVAPRCLEAQAWVEVAHRRIVVPSKRIDLLDAYLPSVGAANNFGGIPGDFA